MTRDELTAKVATTLSETRDALQTVIDELNHGQRQKIVKSEIVKLLLDRYGVDYGQDTSE